MSRLLRGAALGALMFAASVAAAPITAQAQDYDRVVVFGDSLSDNGNLFALAGQPASPPYFNGRFSSGPVFTELLGFDAAGFGSGAAGVNGSVNYAFGGARTDLTATPPFGMRTQLATYRARGGTFGDGDLVSVLGGANNIFQRLEAFAALPPGDPAQANPTGFLQPAAVAAAADINLMVAEIAGAGAGTVLVTNLPKLSLTPQFRTSPAAPLADFGATTFNAALLSGLRTTAGQQPNSNIIMMDLFKVGDVIAANPAAFGISNVTDACFTGTSVCADPSSYFYFDGVHPTATGHRLIADLAQDYLYYGDAGAHSALQGETAFRHRQRGLEGATAALGGRQAWRAGTAISVAGGYDSAETDARGPVGSADIEGHGARMSLESGPSGNLRFGLAGAWDVADVEAGAMSFDAESLSLDLYAGMRADNGLFVTGAVGVARDNFDDISRQTALAPIRHESETSGTSYGARVQGGVWMERGGLAISPRIGATWVSSEVDGYFEQGPAAAYAYGDRTFETISAEATLRLEGALGERFGFHLEGGYRDTLDDRSEATATGIAGNPAQVLYRSVDDPFGGQVLLDAGLTGALTDRLSLDVGYSGRFGDESEGHRGGVRLRLAL